MSKCSSCGKPLEQQICVDCDLTIVSTQDMISRILEWAESHEGDQNFNKSFVEKMQEREVLTESQEDAISNIYTRWKIDQWWSNRFNHHLVKNI